MSPEEKNVIGGIFERLKGASAAPRDAEAEAFIAEQIKAQPYAPYVMTQSIYAQEQALTSMQKQVEQLQEQVRQLEAYAQQVQQQPQSGGFLGGLFGGGARPLPPPPLPARAPFQPSPMGGPPGASPPGPWGGRQAPGPWGQPAQPQGGGMGFLGTAAMTAAGVAGGMLAANAISNMFSGGARPPAAQAAGDTATAATGQTAAAESSAGQGGGYDSASYDDGYDSAGDMGGDDWA